MLDFNTVKLNKNILNQWIDAEVNVCLIGKHGCGKSTMIMEAFNARKLNWKYFSGATLDPWTDVVGIPSIGIEGDNKFIDYILPKSMSDSLEAIFVDEYNRVNKTVRSAIMELVQFKSINGRKFPNLKFVWVAINPETSGSDSELEYDVERLDPAQLDRFHIIVKLPDEPDKMYFMKKFGEHGQSIVEWWKDQPVEVKNFLSARRLEYVINAFQKNLDIHHLLPLKANVATLQKCLAEDKHVKTFNQLVKTKNLTELGKFLSDINNFNRFVKQVPDFSMLKFVHADLIAKYASENSSFNNFLNTKGHIFFPEYSLQKSNLLSYSAISNIELSEQIKSFKSQAGLDKTLYPRSLEFFNKHYAWETKNLTLSKYKLFSAAWQTLEQIETDVVAVANLDDLLQLLGNCHKSTLSKRDKFPELQVFCFFAKRILESKGYSFVNSSAKYKNIAAYLDGHQVQ